MKDKEPAVFSRRDLLKMGAVAGASVILNGLDPIEALAGVQENTSPIPPKTGWVRYQGSLVVWHGDATKNNVFLTIDDGYSHANVEKIAQAAIDENIRTTFCLIGNVVAQYPRGLVRDLVSEGFDFQNHTLTHHRLDLMTKGEIKKEILGAKDSLDKATGQDVHQRFVRPPGEYGVTGVSIYGNLLEALQELDYRLLVWDISSAGTSYGAYSATPHQIEVITDNVVNHMHKGGISLQHAINVDTAAFPTIVKRIKQRGFKPTTVTKGIK